MSQRVRNRCFVVGASRSGTTLVQRTLAAHERVHTFPETGVFLKALGMRRPAPWAWFGWSSGREIRQLRNLARTLGQDAPLPAARPRPLGRAAAHVQAALDAWAEAAGADCWLEKTPRHFIHAGRITRLVEGARMVHVVRDGREVVASIVDRARRYPHRFPRQRDPGYAVRLWNRAVRHHRACLGRPGHRLVHYEALVDDPEGVVRSLCEWLDLEFCPSMLDPRSTAGFVREGEAWKAGAGRPIHPPQGKFDRLFDPASRARIERALDWRSYARLSR